MSLLVFALPGSREGLQVDVGQRNVHIPLQNSHQEFEFRLHKADPDEGNKTDFLERGKHHGGWK